MLGIALLGIRIAAQIPDPHAAFDPEGRGSSGTMALAEILRAQGVEVTATASRVEAMAALGPDTTLAFAQPPALSDEAVEELVAASDNTVIVSASARILRVLDLGEDARGASDAVTASCDQPAFARVGEIVPDRFFAPADGVTGCFTDTEGNAAVLIDTRGDRTLALVHASTLFTNEYLAENGNAALALALLGQRGEVVWYVPSIADSDLEWTEPDTLASLTPEWVTPAIVLLLLTGLAVALWRGRRFGPLVAETLPVTVRASETMHGRAQLTAKAADAAHAADALRIGTLGRLARRLGLGERVPASDVADAAADRLRIPRSSLHDLLRGPLPQTDPELIGFARQLDELEGPSRPPCTPKGTPREHREHPCS
ncbi:DUF4350 domain-containing protein [Microbacterium sp. NIBRBAC000506063]|uniref:DUF4350 domain-containing protein n=1 Tax=Microbacterium sp. NIBRBAC000506063 TaxID=2734618 RepID=UPI001BB4F16B|nr:DUF4350 domain-containing protein [Microbacterium sp. NIBRBAC000506063]QTV79412.1 DUF4350 domain-containing protein [Microbacterium sp. NIBRBAC000506063]